MQCTVEHLSGSKKGQIEQFDGDRIAIGRNPTNTLQFDPAVDLDVSGDHAQLTVGDDGRFMLTDLGSKNGTYLNGTKIAGSVPVEPGSKIQFGKGGPEVRIHYTPGPKKAGATRMLLAQVQQDLELQKARAAESKKKAIIIAVVAVLVIALGGVGAYLSLQHSKKKSAAETAMQLASEAAGRAKKYKAGELYAKEEFQRAEDARAIAEAALAEGRYDDARAAFDEARKLYGEAGEIAERQASEDRLAQALASAQAANEELLRKMREEAAQRERELDEQIKRLEAQGAGAAEELARLRAQKSESEKARAIVQKNSDAVCLIVAETYVQAEGATERTRLATTEGTGFAVSPTRIATAKHVVQPWKYDEKLLATVKKIKDEHRLDVKTWIEVHVQKNGKFEKAFDSGKHKIKLIPAHDTWEKEPRKTIIKWSEVDTQVEVKPHVFAADDLAAIEIEGANLTPVELGPIDQAEKLDPVVILGVSAVGSGDKRKIAYNHARTEVTETGDGSLALTYGLPPSFAGGPVFLVNTGQCVGVVGAIQDQTVTVLSAERAARLKMGGSTVPGGQMPSDAGTAETSGSGAAGGSQ